MRCYVVRKKALLGGGHQFTMYLQQGDLYIMSARRYSSKGGLARYLLASDPGDLDKSRSTCIGKVRGVVGADAERGCTAM